MSAVDESIYTFLQERLEAKKDEVDRAVENRDHYFSMYTVYNNAAASLADEAAEIETYIKENYYDE